MYNLRYWGYIHERARLIKSDGCTDVPDFYLACCEEHDIHYYYARRINPVTGELDVPITFDEANSRLRVCIQTRSVFRWFNPWSWSRYFGTRYFGRCAWNKHRKREADALANTQVTNISGDTSQRD